MNKISNEQFENALNDIDNIRIMEAALNRYRSLDEDELISCKLMGLWYSLRRFEEGRSRFSSYLFGNIVYQCKTCIKKKCVDRNRRVEIYTNLYRNLYRGLSNKKNDTLEDIVFDIPKHYAELIKQRYLMRMTYKEIGEANGYSRETARKNIKNVKNFIKKTYYYEK